jgi:iron complex transport system ATP-binding protein
MVLHDINQAICYSDEAIGLKDGRVIVQGELDEAINSATLQEIFDVPLKVLEMQNYKYVLAV